MAKAKYDLINEQLLLAAVLRDEPSRRRALACADRRDFFRARHRVIFKAVAGCQADGVDPEEAALVIRAKGDFGGLAYLRKLLGTPVTKEIDRCLDGLRKDAARARVGAQAEDLVEAAQDRSVDFGEVVSEARGIFQGLRSAPLSRLSGDANADDWRKRMDGKAIFVPTGYDPLDGVLNEGLTPGGMTVVAGRPRMGKTMLMVDWVRRIMRHTELRQLVGMLEKDRDYFINLLAANLTGIDKRLIVKDRDSLTKKQRRRIDRAIEKVFATGRLVVSNSPVMDLIREGRWTNEAAVDKMGELIVASGCDVGWWDIWQRAMKDKSSTAIEVSLLNHYEIGKATGTHSVILQQLHRRVEDRSKDKARRPTLADLKQSGAYEEVPDQVIFVHREKVFKKHVVRGDVMEVILAKQKMGEADVTMVAKFSPETCRLSKPRLAGAEDLMPGAGFI